MRQLLIEAELMNLRRELRLLGKSEQYIDIVVNELRQHTTSNIGGVEVYNN
jgi:hypothetical protein